MEEDINSPNPEEAAYPKPRPGIMEIPTITVKLQISFPCDPTEVTR